MHDTDPIAQRKKKLAEIIQKGFDPYPHKFDYTHTVSQLIRQFSAQTHEELEAKLAHAQTCGRLIALRAHGKVAFGHVSDGESKIQIYIKKDKVGERAFELYQLLDVGDVIGVGGQMFRTRTGELTIFADRLQLLAKSLHPLPEKWHGLTDTEMRYRQRYVDLIANPEVREIFKRRAGIVRELRNFFDEREYMEVETPMMQVMAGGATARPFETFHKALGIRLYLRIAPELYLKRLVVGGFPRVYEINRNFRNEGISTMHNPEFTMLEFYQAYSNYFDLMDLSEEMLTRVVERATGSRQVEYQGKTIDFNTWRRFTLIDSVLHFWNLRSPKPAAADLKNASRLRTILEVNEIAYLRSMGAGALLGQLFESVVEHQLVQPTIIHDYPVELSPLSKTRDDDPATAERFELFVGGMEIANAYSELNDPEEQRRRFDEQLKKRAAGDEEAHGMDEDYIRALSYGMPPTAGEGIGVDRLTMILTNTRSIREVILFPHLRPECE
ncbi:MAG TPA: lysine--tRNA ligase [Acidobacteriota bacterium]|jgi:lysyl-tRNA synthetase class 2|nr:lysine--tRNA ligase [Acidobacteriota bacterium]